MAFCGVGIFPVHDYGDQHVTTFIINAMWDLNLINSTPIHPRVNADTLTPDGDTALLLAPEVGDTGEIRRENIKHVL